MDLNYNASGLLQFGGSSGGSSVVVLPTAQYGDFNSINWNSLPSGTYTMTGLGSAFSNLPTGYVLLGASTYVWEIQHINVTNCYSDNVWFASDTDFTNQALGRPAIRTGANFGSAQAVGWRILGYKAEQAYSLDAQVRTTKALPLSPTVFIWDTIASEKGKPSYDNVTGIFTCPFTGVYIFQFTKMAKATSGTTDSIYSAAEIDTGGGFAPSTYSSDEYFVRSNTTRNQIASTSPSPFNAGTKLRFPFWCVAGTDISNFSPSGAFINPAARLQIVGIETQ